jgi:hypothetical protein
LLLLNLLQIVGQSLERVQLNDHSVFFLLISRKYGKKNIAAAERIFSAGVKKRAYYRKVTKFDHFITSLVLWHGNAIHAIGFEKM